MDNQFAHDYVHVKSVGNLSICKETIQDTNQQLTKLYKDENIMGYQLLLIENLTDVENQLVMCNFNKVTQGKFPFVYSCIQPIENNTLDFDRLMEELDYKRVDV